MRLSDGMFVANGENVLITGVKGRGNLSPLCMYTSVIPGQAYRLKMGQSYRIPGQQL
jgi:hypothetical protein